MNARQHASRRFLQPLSQIVSRVLLVLVVVLMATAAPVPVQAQSGQNVSVGVSPILVMSVSGNPMMQMVDRSQRSGRITLTDPSTFYNLTSNVDNVRLEAVLDIPLPEGVRLDVRLQSTLGRSHGWVALSGASTVLSGMGRGLENGQTITYRLIVDPEVAELPLQFRRVAFSLVSERSSQPFTVVQDFGFGVLPDVRKTDSGR